MKVQMIEIENKQPVILFLVDLTGGMPSLEDLTEIIPESEALYSQKYEITRRNSFLAGRTVLRTIISKILEIKPREVNFSISPKGKPFLTSENNKPQIKFNMSDSGCFIFMGVTPEFEIGVDIQEIRELRFPERIMKRQLTDSENELINNLPAERRYTEFYKFWARKEAVLKASGYGLSYPMKKLDLSKCPEEPAICNFKNGTSGTYFISDIYLGNSCKACAAIESSPFSYKLLKLSLKDILNNKFTIPTDII